MQIILFKNYHTLFLDLISSFEGKNLMQPFRAWKVSLMMMVELTMYWKEIVKKNILNHMNILLATWEQHVIDNFQTSIYSN